MMLLWNPVRATDRDRAANNVTINAGRRGQTGIAYPTSRWTEAIPGPRAREREPGTRRGAVGRSWNRSQRGATTAPRPCLDAERKEMTQ